MEAFQLEIQSLTPENLNSVLELDKACFGGLWTLEAYQRELDSSNSDLIGLFSPVFPSKVLGMGCFWSILDEAHITLLAVHPQYQHQGFGQAVLYSLLRIACDRGLERATLEVRASNFAAISLYQKFGFKIAGRRRRYYKDNDEDAIIFWLGDLQQADFEETLERFYIIVRDRLRKSSWELVY
ncbi:ribosomal protein S18-alanine N-acetyltransferase [Aetokthonos hydrillicola Thurmond2011]|jgi:ribosomal-protein-alanine N-acetyltransferase|uniref:Ribosomal protein S18-alanine N-acetyltransferase n=1 Tax=Aetokthonos hydrillicola Thurmond2011 TaxID=2712845 RepID=A0AAP5I5D2_9CYAN|nr:ribosomal protein S18-alanine N-acetyltransferase [Aetokthonos hydrillicola]MBO3462606.1 ribosomal protein S18-alanine N-acetyltransferase [Aetokthonos hydrillicola CCALA 1050]MBW4588098.1 ribosomal protein S18-alanine N-acetyltransferase [Aetokthonos hydrillicola CCALA 1050]MDR9893413.1 ribosomal protein S18-alanine N-acetyltransferase [Aetokthonos hydrillicola Thurmond2011]